jgi:uncharacterized FlaG/YvyC family protein
MSDLVDRSASITFDHASLSTTKAVEQDAEQVLRAVQYLNRTEFLGKQSNASLSFAYDEASQRAVVTVVDRTTGDVLSQMPAREVLRLAAEARRKQRHAAGGEPPGNYRG